MRRPGELQRNSAAARLLEINDASAIPALEAVMSGESPEAAFFVVETLGKMTGPEASMSLARHAVLSAWPGVREAAALQLQSRKMETYVPTLLATMYTPVTSRAAVVRNRNGELLFRHAFVREGQDQQQMLVLDTEYRRMALPGGDPGNLRARAFTNIRGVAVARQRNVELQNRLTQAVNQRITSVLNIVTNQQLAVSPQDWWQWWNEQNEVYVSGQKPTQTVHRSGQVALVDRVTLSGGGLQAADCLAAGTPVWTATGPMEIQQIRIGDLVLAQNPETGELAYKPVLQTTVRPKGLLLKVRAGGDTFETSGGHLFWISGEGWVKCRKLKSGMELHGVTGTVRISTTEEGRNLETYNLVVADFNTYFVGETKILCHDNTVRQPTKAIVPGLLAE